MAEWLGYEGREGWLVIYCKEVDVLFVYHLPVCKLCYAMLQQKGKCFPPAAIFMPYAASPIYILWRLQ